jgi:hypothetical protein
MTVPPTVNALHREHLRRVRAAKSDLNQQTTRRRARIEVREGVPLTLPPANALRQMTTPGPRNRIMKNIED